MAKITKIFKKIGIIKEPVHQYSEEICPNSIFQDYSTLCLNQPQLNLKGIWKKDKIYHLVCVGLQDDQRTLDGELITKWFRDHKILGSRSKLISHIPLDSKKIRLLGEKEILNLAGVARNITFFYYDLLLNLPKEFPEFRIKDENGIIEILSRNILTETEKAIFQNALNTINETLTIIFKGDQELGEQENLINSPMLIIPTQTDKRLEGAIKHVAEEDQDFWLSNKKYLIDPKKRKTHFLENDWLPKSSSCLISDYVEPGNIRHYLTLYNTVFLRLPIKEHHEIYFKNLSCTTNELLEMCKLNRIKLIYDQPLHRYNTTLLNFFYELNSSSYILTRRMASVIVTDLRHRMPLLFPTFDIEAKYEILHGLTAILQKTHREEEISKFIKCLNILWGNYYEGIQRGGCFGLIQFGIHHFFDFLFKEKNMDFGVELMDVEPGVNYAAALNANCISRTSINDEALVNMIANFYSGIPKDFIPGNQVSANTAVDNILVLNNDIPVVELCKTFKSGDIERFHKCIYNLTRHKKDDGEIADTITAFNAEVIHFAEQKRKTQEFNIKGFLLDLTLGSTSIPFSGWLADHFSSFATKIGLRNSSIRQASDYFQSFATTVPPDAVLVARMRDHLAKTYIKDRFGY